MRISLISECTPDVWDEFCCASKDAWLFHRWHWVEIERQFACLNDHSFAVLSADGEICAILPLFEYRLGLGSWIEKLLAAGHPRQSGPAFHPKFGKSDLKAAQSAMMRHLFDLAQQIDADRIQLSVQSLAPSWRDARRFDIPFWLRDKRFERGPAYGPNGQLPCPGLSSYALEQIVTLQKPIEVLQNEIDPGCRRAIRKAVSFDLQTSVEHGASAVAEFYRLALKSADRTGEQLADIAYYQGIDSVFGPPGRARIIFVRHEGETAAALFIVADKNVMSFLAAASDADKHHLRVNDLIHWNAILWGRDRGLEMYRLGAFLPQIAADTPIGRVTRFKTKFANRQYEAIVASHYRNAKKYHSLGYNYIEHRCNAPSVASRAQ